MTKHFLKLLGVALSMGASLHLNAQNDWFAISKINQHVSALAHDSMRGRATGSEGETMAANYIISQFKAFGLKPLAGDNNWKQAFDFKTESHGAEARVGKANNVIAWLDNNAPLNIIIGAHYDHLGEGEDGHSLDPAAKGKIHNGADDNASGVAGLIELARYFAKNAERERFNILFVAFSGEELGLLGSDWFVQHPSIDLAKVNCMINMDMIGRLNPAKPQLTVSGSGTAAVWENLLRSFSSAAMEIKTDSSGLGPSDHASFYKKNIPALHFFTGSHADYHKPSDDVEKINSRGIEAVLMVIAGLIEKLPDEKLTFLKTRNASQGSRASFKVSLGIMPSYANSENGLKAEAILDGKPGAKAGMKDGDVIVRIGEHVVKDIQTYMEALGKFEKGQKTSVTVIRDTQTLTLPIEF